MRPHEYGRASAYVRSSNDAPIYNDQIQNLDMELKILERQREIIKQKQKESLMISQRQNVYNQPSSSYGHHESKQNTASYHQRKGKRPFEGNWQSQTSAKQSRINPWEALYDNTSQNLRPLMKINTNQNKSNIPKNKPKPGTNFKSPSVWRIRDFVPKNSNANSNVPKTANNSTSDSNKKKNAYTKEILRPFVEPSRSMRGRLELALGDITKQLKQSKGLDAPTLQQLQTPAAQRQVKNIIRQRISNVMMNKLVGTAADILVHYHKKYPNDVDEEILKAIKFPPPKFDFVNPISTEESDKIRAFFKSKMSKLLKDKMTEMINKLSSIYGDNESEILKCLEDLPDIENIDNEENKKSEVDDKKESKENQGEVEEQKDSIESDNADSKKDSIESDNAKKDSLESDDADAEKDGIEGDTADANKDILESDNADAEKDGIEGDTADANKDSIESDNAGTEKESGNETMTIDDDKETNVETAEKKPEKSSKVDQYYKLMDLLITKRLPVIMEKFKEDFVKLMFSDQDFTIARLTVLGETKRMLKKAFAIANEGKIPKKESAEEKPGKEDKKEKANSTSTQKSEPIKETDNKKETASSTSTPMSGQLYVVLLSRPSLPPKPVIYEFLNKFKPQSIKKHKTLDNLLVIGFNNEEDYNNILAANKSKVGDATFIIKANEVIAAEKQNESTAAVDKEKTDENKTKVTNEATHQDIKENITNEQDVIEITEENNGGIKDTNDQDIIDISDANNEDIKVKNDQDIIDISDEKSQEQENDTKVEDNAGENKDVNMETIPEAVEENAANGVKETAVATPTRSSSRLANIAPSTIKTRRASRLAQ